MATFKRLRYDEDKEPQETSEEPRYRSFTGTQDTTLDNQASSYALVKNTQPSTVYEEPEAESSNWLSRLFQKDVPGAGTPYQKQIIDATADEKAAKKAYRDAYYTGNPDLLDSAYADYASAKARKQEATSKALMNDAQPWISEQEAKYATLSSEPDYAEKNQPNQKILQNLWASIDTSDLKLGDNKSLYYNINQRRGKSNAGPWAYMTDEEAQNYNYLYARDPKEAQEYYNFIERDLNARRTETTVKTATDFAAANPGAASALGRVANVASGAGTLSAISQRLFSDDPRGIDYNKGAFLPSRINTAMTKQVASDIEKDTPGWTVGKDASGQGGINITSQLYQLGMSGVDSAVVAGLSAMGLPSAGIILGGSAATQGILDAKERGASDDQALLTGLAQGVAEMFFEEFSIERLIHTPAPDTFAQLMKNVALQGLTEGSEEVWTSLANALTDALINGGRSELNTRISELKAAGYQNAEKLAWVEFARNIAMDFFGGALLGGVMGGGGSAVNYAFSSGQRALGAQLRASGTTNADVSEAISRIRQTTKNADTLEYLDEVQRHAQKGKASDTEIGNIFMLYQRSGAGNISTASGASENPEPATAGKPGEGIDPDFYAQLLRDAEGGYDSLVEGLKNPSTEPSINPATQNQTENPIVQNPTVQPPDIPSPSHAEAPVRASEPAAPATPAATENVTEQPAASIDELSAQYGKQAEAFKRTYNEGQDVEQYAAAYRQMFEYGKYGVRYEYASEQPEVSYLTDRQRQIVYETGRASVPNTGTENSGISNAELTEAASNGTINANPITTEGEESNGQEEAAGRAEGNDGGRTVPDRRAERKNRVGADWKNNAEFVESLRRTGKQRERQRSIRHSLEALRLGKVSTESVGVDGGTENKTLSVLPDTPLDEATEKLLEEIGFRRAQRSFARKGITVKGFIGTLEFADESGVHTARGWTSPDGKTVYVAIDHQTLSHEQILLHEYFHALVKRNPGLLGEVAAKFDEQYTEAERRAIVNDYYDAYGFYDLSEDYVLEEVLADYYGGIDIFSGTEDAQTDFDKRRGTVMLAARKAAQNGQERTEADTGGGSRFSENRRRDRPERRRALIPGEMVNEFRDKINWREYYAKISEAEYNPDYFEDESIATIKLDGGLAVIEMQRNGEWQVKEYRSYEDERETQKSYADEEVSGERDHDGDQRGRVLGNTDRTGGRDAERGGIGEASEGNRETRAAVSSEASGDGLKENGGQRFSMDAPVEETDRLVAMHNISESGLLSALELGGLAMPSFAVMRAGTIQNGYGDITIVAGKDSIDPKIKNQSIFGGDAWTPTFPEISYKISKTEQGRIVKRIESLLGPDVKILGGTSAITDDNLSRAIQNADGDFARAVKNNRVMQVAFLRDSGESLEIPRLAPYSKYGLNAEDYQAILDAFGGELPRGYDAEMSQEEKLRNLLRERTLNAGTDRETAREIADALYSEELNFSGVDDIFNNTRKFQLGEGRPDTKRIDTEIKAAMEGREAEYADWLNELGRGIVEKKGIYNDKDIFTASGNRRSWDALHYDFTLANIVKAMQKQPKQGKTGFLTATGSVKGAALKSYNSVEDVRADIGRLSSEEDETAKEAYRKFGESVREIADRISDDPFDGSEALADILSHTKTKTAIYRYLTKEYDYLEERGIDLESLAEDIAELGKEANTLPMEYFEAKVYRAFPADEALAYVVPDDVSRRLIDGLEAQGLNVLTYEAGNEADRLAKINSVEGARFSRNLPGETAELQDEYDKLKEKLAYWKGQVKRTEHYTLREADTKRLTKSILDQYSSKADAGNIGERVKSLGEYLMNGDEGGVRWVDAHDDAVRIARDIIQNASALVDDGERDTYRRMKAYFHGKSIRVTNAKNSITDYNDFRKRNFGKFILSDNGAPIDTLWGELQEEFGKGYFPDEVMNQEDMIFHVSDLLDALRDNYENPYQGYYAEAVEYCANDILDRLLSDEVRQTPPTFADKAETRLARQALQWEDKLERQAERFEERYQKRVLKDEERYQRVRYLLDQERENRKAQVEEVKRSHRSKEAKAREARKAAALRKKITSHARELTSLLLKPSDKRHIPKGLEKPVAALLNAIDLSSGYVLEFGRDGKYHRVDPTLTIGGEETQRTEAFRQIQEQLRKMKGEWADDGTLFGDTEEPGLFTTVIEDYADIPIANMNSEQLQTVWDALRTVEGAIRSMNRLFSTTRWQNQAELAADIRKQNAGKTKPKEYRGFFGKAQNTAGIDAMTPEAYFHRLGAVGDEMFRLARDAQDRNIRIIDEARQKTEEIVGDTDVRKLEREMHTVTFGGEPVQISTAQLMELYALSRRDQGLQHILTGGILIEETQKGLVRNISVEPVRVTPADLSEAISMLTAEQRRMAERMQEYLSVDMARVGNEAAVQVYNYEKFGRDGIYWPIRTNKNEVATEVGNDNKVTTPAQRGFTKAVKPNAKTSLKVGSIFDTYAKHISDMANYASWLGFTEDMNRVRNFNFKDADGISTGTVKGILNRVYGSGGAAYLENLLADISNGAGVDEKAMTNEFVGNYKAAAIGANLRVILQQPTAILRAADMIDGKYLAAGLANPFKGFEESKKYAPISIWKDWGYFDINTGRQMKDVLFDNTDKLAKAKELSMALAGKADSFAWGQLWNACKAEARAETNLEPGSREFFRHVADRFNEIIDHTQVVDGVLQRSQAMRSKSWLMKTATSFMAEPTKQYNMFLSAVYDAKHGDDKAKKRLARTVAALLISGIVNSVVQSVWDAVRDDDKDKEYWEKFLSAFIGYDPEADTFRKGFKSYFDSNVGTMLNPGSYIPFFKDAVSLLQGYEVSRMDMAAIDGMISAASSWVKSVKGESKKTAGYATMKLIENAAKLLGIPLYNIERDLTAITDTIATATKSYPLQYQMYRAVNRPPDSGKPNADVTTMLYNAYMADNGDYDQITRMMEKDGYDAEEIRKAVETKWKSEHGITDALKAVDPEGDYNLLDIVTAVDSLELPTADADLVLSMELEDKQLEKYTAARKSGVSPETYIEAVLTLPKFDLNSNGSYSGDEVEAALKSMKGLNDEKRAVLWQTLSDAKTAANNPFDADAGMEFLITSASVDIPELVLPTADGDTTDFSKELSKAKKLSDKERLAAIGEIIGTEMKNESGKPSQYAKLIDCLDKGCSFDEWSRLIQYDYGVDQYLKLRESGVSHSGSMSLTETIKNLSPAAGKSSVSDEQKINSVVGTKLSDKEKLSAIGTIIGTDMTTDSGNPTQWAKLNTAVNDGLSVDDAIRMAQNDTLDDYIRWRDSAVRQSGVKSDVYISYRSETAKISADKDANGKSISGSKKEKVLKYINSLKLTAAQKDALYYDAGYAESGIDDAPWHGLQLPTE